MLYVFICTRTCSRFSFLYIVTHVHHGASAASIQTTTFIVVLLLCACAFAFLRARSLSHWLYKKQGLFLGQIINNVLATPVLYAKIVHECVQRRREYKILFVGLCTSELYMKATAAAAADVCKRRRRIVDLKTSSRS